VLTADIHRLAAGAHPNLERTLFVATVEPGLPPRAEASLRAALGKIDALARQVERLELRVAACEASDPLQKAVAVGHAAFVCRPSGYEVLERDGPPPGLDDVVMLGDEAFVVSRLAPSPFPGDARRCAILTRA
jgi:hypothetical protein